MSNDPPRNKPEGMWNAEWAARHMDFRFPEITDVAFLAEFKKVMIEVAGDRLYDYRAAEQVEKCLVSGGHSCPSMEKEAAAEGFSRYSKIKDFIRFQLDVVLGSASKWAGHDPIHLEMWPAWRLTRCWEGQTDDWRERWESVGGRFTIPLISERDSGREESGMIALKTDPIWKELGNPTIFPDALGIDHPPFYLNSGLSWREVGKCETMALGLMPPDRSPEEMMALVKSHIASELIFNEILDRDVAASNKAYLEKNPGYDPNYGIKAPPTTLNDYLAKARAP